MNAQTLVMRDGKPGGGKGPLVADEIAMTLSTTAQQTLFAPTAPPSAAYRCKP